MITGQLVLYPSSTFNRFRRLILIGASSSRYHQESLFVSSLTPPSRQTRRPPARQGAVTIMATKFSSTDMSPSLNEEVVSATGHQYKIVTLKHWYADVTTKSSICNDKISSSKRLPILDIRTPQQFHENRIAINDENNIVVVPLEMKLLKERSFELPARHVEFAILCHEESQLQELWEFMGPQRFSSSSNKKRRRIAQRPWKIRYALQGNDRDTWEQAKELGLYESGLPQPPPDLVWQGVNNNNNKYKDGEPMGRRQRRRPLPRLWQPDCMIQNVLMPLLRSRVVDIVSSSPSSFGCTPLQIWDLGSGAGRDVAFVAEELLLATSPTTSEAIPEAVNMVENPHFTVMAVDHRYNDKETNITSQFLERRGVGSVTRVLKIDVSVWANVETAILQQQSHEVNTTTTQHVLYCVRFWKRTMVEALVKANTLPVGTLFAISHFCKAQPGGTWDFDHPSEKTVLERDELSTLFTNIAVTTGNSGEEEEEGDSGPQWAILHDEIAMDSDHGRTMVHFVARKVQ